MIKSYISVFLKNASDYFHNIDVKAFDFKALNLSNHFVELIILIITILVLSGIINAILSRTILGKNYRVFVAPGVILHELAHAFFCLVTGAKIKSVALFDADGGSVTHEQPKIPILGTLLIAFAPLLIGVVAIFFISKWIGLRSETIDFGRISLSEIMNIGKSTLSAINFSYLKNWLLLYLVFSIAITMTPSAQDLKNAFLSFLGAFLIIFLAVHFFFPGSLSHMPIDRLLLVLSTVTVLLIFALLFSIIIFAITKLFSRS